MYFMYSQIDTFTLCWCHLECGTETGQLDKYICTFYLHLIISDYIYFLPYKVKYNSWIIWLDVWDILDDVVCLIIFIEF